MEEDPDSVLLFLALSFCSFPSCPSALGMSPFPVSLRPLFCFCSPVLSVRFFSPFLCSPFYFYAVILVSVFSPCLSASSFLSFCARILFSVPSIFSSRVRSVIAGSPRELDCLLFASTHTACWWSGVWRAFPCLLSCSWPAYERTRKRKLGENCFSLSHTSTCANVKTGS